MLSGLLLGSVLEASKAVDCAVGLIWGERHRRCGPRQVNRTGGGDDPKLIKEMTLASA
jgi:hypothetical protein